MRMWRALLCEEVHVRAPLEEAAAFFGGSMTRELSYRSGTGASLTPCVLRSIAFFSAAGLV